MPALVTPFSRDGEIDITAHKKNMRVLAECGIEGFVIGGSNGEGPYLEPGERAALVKAGRRRKAHFMVGIMAQTIRTAMAQAEEATDAGADTLLVLTPTTLARGEDEVVHRFFKTIADQVSLPVLIYSVPRVSGYSIPVELAGRLARHQNIIGMKDSSGDVVRLQALVDATPHDFIIYSGNSPSLTAAITVGCDGAITGSGNYAPELVLRVLAMAQEDPIKARRLQRKLTALSRDVEAHGVPGVKAAAKAAGLEPGYPREPLVRLSRGAETSIAKLIT